MIKTKPAIGIIGSGRLGSALAKQLLDAGYPIAIANSRGAESLSLIIKVLLPGARPASLNEVITESDMVILGMPLNQYNSLSPELLAGKIVIDAMNYWPPTEGDIAEFMNDSVGSSEYIQQYLPAASVVKSLNHIAYNELAQHSQPDVALNRRRAIALAGGNIEVKKQVAQLINDIGFAPVDLGRLANGKYFQPDTQLFNTRLIADEMKALRDATTLP